MKGILYWDGGARPTNPGHAGFAAVVFGPESENWETPKICSRYIGIATNNVAEYTGLIVGIKFAYQLGIRDISIQGDSKLIVNQVLGLWQCKSDDLRPYFKDAKKLLDSLFYEAWEIKWIKRNCNGIADDYCTKAIWHGMNRNPFIPQNIKDKRPGEVYDLFGR